MDRPQPDFQTTPLNRSRRRFLAGAAGALLAAHTSGLPSAFAGRWVEAWNWSGINLRSQVPFGSVGVPAQELATLRKTIAEHLKLAEPTGTVNVTIFGSRRAFREHMHVVAPEAMRREALFLRTDIADHVYCYSHGGVGENLRHELTHAWMHQMATFVPTWIDEGLASYYQEPSKTRAWQEPFLREIRWRLRFGRTTSIADLERVKSLKQMTDDRYRDAWSWIHFLYHESAESVALIRDYFATMERGQLPDPLSKTVAAALPDVRARYKRHFLDWPEPSA